MSVLHPIAVTVQLKDWGTRRFEILHEGERFVLHCDGEAVAACDDARALSNWALDKGATAVYWNGDAFLWAEHRY